MAINLYLGDCMEAMKSMKENQYDLAIVDPPYGIGFHKENTTMSAGERKDGTRRKMETWSNPKPKNYTEKEWDNQRPSRDYFVELDRISADRIIWGGNYFADFLQPHGGWIFWDKGVPDGMSLSKGELAYNTTLNSVSKISLLWAGYKKCEQSDRFHPTQKPVKLYEWLLMNYAKPNQKILDTHGGSMSIALAVHNVNEREGMNLSLDLWEIDEEYYKAGVERYQRHIAQTTIFS